MFLSPRNTRGRQWEDPRILVTLCRASSLIGKAHLLHASFMFCSPKRRSPTGGSFKVYYYLAGINFQTKQFLQSNDAETKPKRSARMTPRRSLNPYRSNGDAKKEAFWLIYWVQSVKASDLRGSPDYSFIQTMIAARFWVIKTEIKRKTRPCIGILLKLLGFSVGQNSSLILIVKKERVGVT